jgi:hypothetical protein
MGEEAKLSWLIEEPCCLEMMNPEGVFVVDQGCYEEEPSHGVCQPSDVAGYTL